MTWQAAAGGTVGDANATNYHGQVNQFAQQHGMALAYSAPLYHGRAQSTPPTSVSTLPYQGFDVRANVNGGSLGSGLTYVPHAMFDKLCTPPPTTGAVPPWQQLGNVGTVSFPLTAASMNLSRGVGVVSLVINGVKMIITADSGTTPVTKLLAAEMTYALDQGAGTLTATIGTAQSWPLPSGMTLLYGPWVPPIPCLWVVGDNLYMAASLNNVPGIYVSTPDGSTPTWNLFMALPQGGRSAVTISDTYVYVMNTVITGGNPTYTLTPTLTYYPVSQGAVGTGQACTMPFASYSNGDGATVGPVTICQGHMFVGPWWAPVTNGLPGAWTLMTIETGGVNPPSSFDFPVTSPDLGGWLLVGQQPYANAPTPSNEVWWYPVLFGPNGPYVPVSIHSSSSPLATIIEQTSWGPMLYDGTDLFVRQLVPLLDIPLPYVGTGGTLTVSASYLTQYGTTLANESQASTYGILCGAVGDNRLLIIYRDANARPIAVADAVQHENGTWTGTLTGLTYDGVKLISATVLDSI